MRVIASIYAIHSHMRGNHEASGKRSEAVLRSAVPAPLTLAGHKLHPTLPAGSFFHLLVFLTLIGGLSNNNVISSDQDKYYVVFLLLVYRLAPRTFRLRI